MADSSSLMEDQPPKAAAPNKSAIRETAKKSRAPRRSSIFSRLKNLATLVALILVWQLVSTFWLPRIDPYRAVLMPPPSQIIVAAWELLRSGEFIHHLLDSLTREAVAFCAALLAVPLGIAMGWSSRINSQLEPVFEVLRPVPPLAWIPLSILWFGIGDEQNEFIIFLGMFFPILLNTTAGVKNVDPNLVRAARSLGAPERKVLTRVVFKAALPQIVTGVRIGLGIGWMALVAAELVGANSGLGFLINDARSMLRTDIIIVGMLTIGIMGLIIDASLRMLMRRLLPWSRAMSG
jgi:ABC-type nitrate/sulfonate/bicarbonate transport system permease component